MITTTSIPALPAQRTASLAERLVSDMLAGHVAVEAFCSAVAQFGLLTQVTPHLAMAASVAETSVPAARAQRRLGL